jgi:hypothetical protein
MSPQALHQRFNASAVTYLTSVRDKREGLASP